MSKNTPPQWLCDKLQIGGLSKIEARVQATSITKIVRQGMINNWMKRQSLIIRDPQKLVIPKQATHSSFSQWGKHVKQATTVPPPATTQTNPNAPKFTNNKQQLKTVRKEKQDTNSPSKSKGKTLGLPKNLRGKTIEKTIQQETETDNRIRGFFDRSITQIPQELTACTTCKTRRAKRIWKDPTLTYLCAPCRTELERGHPEFDPETHKVSCVHCGTHNPGSKPWLHPPFLLSDYAICTSCRPPVGAKITTSPPLIISRRANPVNCEACTTPLGNKKVYHRNEIALCHACHSATTSKTQIEYALARFQVREAGYLPYSFSELHTHDVLLHELMSRIRDINSGYRTLTENQITHIIAYLQHQAVTRFPSPPPSTRNIERSALTISNLAPQSINEHQPTRSQRHACPFCESIIIKPNERINHIQQTCAVRFDGLQHPPRPPDF